MSDQDDTNYRTFVQLFTRHESGLRSFVRSMLPTWDDTDEVMQNVSIVLWTKFRDFDPSTAFMKWACVVARFEVLKYRRSKARDRLCFNDTIIELLADEAIEEIDERRREHRALDRCLQKLPEGKRTLLMQVYAGSKINSVAEVSGITPTALYKALRRMRRTLYLCIQASLTEEPA